MVIFRKKKIDAEFRKGLMLDGTEFPKTYLFA